ncbi:uncharacterized protein HaLaN_11957 [Haematococcus lacustris]|uniref:Geranylgeranyl transferase type II subunit beta n=1 Tax=Haematococcus lacustris TaxID=44745 RepID=A0A699Z2B7_HAELA|nr:uncharacterized protein HaLaN_11957 [Haematococcus lacustris]
MGDITPDDLGCRAQLLVDKHAEYIRSFSKIWENTDKIEFVATEHFWMGGMYWGLTAMSLLGKLEDMDEAAITSWVLSCQHEGTATEVNATEAQPGSCQHPGLLDCRQALDLEAALRFIDEDDGGISDRPEDMADVYHTFFGIAALSLMGYPGLQGVDPTWALPVSVVERLKKAQEQQRAVKTNLTPADSC